MRPMITDTSCLIRFTELDRTDLLRTTFADVTLTDGVVEEYGSPPEGFNATGSYDQLLYQKFPPNLGSGESSCQALALAESDSLLLNDDKMAKKTAENLGIECVGSPGVHLFAKDHGVIAAVRPVIERIKQTDFRHPASSGGRLSELLRPTTSI